MISTRILGKCLLFPAMLFLLPRTTSAATQGSECSAQDLLAVLKTDDPAYTDAMELAQILRNHGFTVKCVLQSKMIRLFEGQKGAALYRTNRGDFEALFLPKTRTFAVQPIETRENGGRVCEQRYAAERVLPESRFELQHTGSPSKETALEEKV